MSEDTDSTMLCAVKLLARLAMLQGGYRQMTIAQRRKVLKELEALLERLPVEEKEVTP